MKRDGGVAWRRRRRGCSIECSERGVEFFAERSLREEGPRKIRIASREGAGPAKVFSEDCRKGDANRAREKMVKR